MPQAHLSHQEADRGYRARPKRSCDGLKRPLLVTPQGHPVEGWLTPGASSDGRALRSVQFDVPEGRVLAADHAYHEDGREAVRYEAAQMALSPLRKEHAKRAFLPSRASVPQA